jgi:hypothetical protein
MLIECYCSCNCLLTILTGSSIFYVWCVRSGRKRIATGLEGMCCCEVCVGKGGGGGGRGRDRVCMDVMERLNEVIVCIW